MSTSSFTAVLVDDNHTRKNSIPGGCTAIDIDPDLPGPLAGGQVVVSDAPAALGDLVPLARTLSTRIVADVLNRAESSGRKVPCGKGCSACCRYLVPLSAPEALWMGREIGSLSENCEPAIAQAFTDAASRILGGWSESPFSQANPDADDGCDPESVGQWYAGLDLDCPFLSEGICTIYDKRPIACREHAVFGVADHCQGFAPGQGCGIEMPVKVLDALGQLACEVEQTEVQAVMMPLVPFWYEENRRRALRTWRGPELVSRFLTCLAETAHEASGVSEAA